MVDPCVEIVPLKVVEELRVVVELPQHAINADEFQRREISSPFTLQPEFFRADIGRRELQAGIMRHRHRHQVVPRLLGFPRQFFGRDLDRLRLRKSELVSQKNFQLIFPALELQDSLDHLRLRELGFSHFHWQFVSFSLPFLRHLEDLFRALLLLAQ